MATRDHTDDPIPEPDAPATASERAQAESLAALVDRVIAGADLPPAMASEERALVEAATMIHAGANDVALDRARQAALIERALELALPGRARADSEPSGRGEPERGSGGASADPGVVRLDARRERRAWRSASRLAPWAIAVASAAAALVLAVRPDRRAGAPVAELAPATAPMHRSRPADDLVGEIAREDADQASARVDVIYTDRMAGYRDLTLRGGRR